MPVGETCGTYHHTITEEEMPKHQHMFALDNAGNKPFSMLDADSSGICWTGDTQYHIAAKRNVENTTTSAITETQL